MKNARCILTAVIFTLITMMLIQRGGFTAEMLAMTLFSELEHGYGIKK